MARNSFPTNPSSSFPATSNKTQKGKKKKKKKKET